MNKQYVAKLSSDELLMQFVEAPDWSASQTLVLQNSELLSDNAEKSLRSMIEVANAISDTPLKACGEAHQELLSRCRASGVVNAFRGWSPPAGAKIPGVRLRYCEALDSVGTTLRARYQKSGNPTDLEIAFKMHVTAVTLFPDLSARRADLLDNAALDLYLRFQLTSNMDDLNFAIYGWEEALKLPARSPQFGADYRLNLGSMLRLRFAANANPVDLERAIGYFREAMSMTSVGSERYARALEQIQLSEKQRAGGASSQAHAG